MSTTIHGPGEASPEPTRTSVHGDEIEATDFEDAVVGYLEDQGLKVERDVAVPESGPLFDPEPYRIKTPVFDNLSSDKLAVAFGGMIELDATDEDDLALFDRLQLGKPFTFTAHAYVQAKQGSYKENADGEVSVAGKALLKIHSLTLQDS